MTKTPKPRTIAYIRVSTDDQDVDKQRLEILDYGNRQGLKIDEFISIEMSSRRTPKERRIEELMEKLREGDTLIISELSRIGRSIPEVIALVNAIIERKIRLIAIKQNLDLKGTHDMTSKVMVTVFSLLSELERDLISLRTKTALSAIRRNGVVLGRPRGKPGKSRLDGLEEEIKKQLDFGVSKVALARMLQTSRGNLINFIKKRNIAPIGLPPPFKRRNGNNGN